MPVAFYYAVWEEIEASPNGLRAACKAHLVRLGAATPGIASGLRLEKVHPQITELKISWNRQEFRLLFYRERGLIHVVNFFQKKTRKCPPNEIERALRRMREIELDQAKLVTGSLH
jgi:phage-related protein